MTRWIRLLGLSALVLLAAAVVFMASNDTRAQAPPFNPGGLICFDSLETPAECDGDAAAGAASDISGKFCIGWGPACSTQPIVANVKESNFGGVVALFPTAFVPASVTPAPVGSLAGYLTARPVLGLINNACSSQLGVAFSLMIASTNLSDTISPKPVGQINPAEPLALDANPANGIPDGADKYPSYLKTFFRDLQPRARLFGVSKIQGSWVTLNFLFFDPGAHVVTDVTDVTFKPELGIPSITVLGDPSVPPSPSAISDFCAPLLSANITFGKTMNNPCTPLPSPAGSNCPGQATRENSGYPFLPCEATNNIDDDGDAKVNDGCPQVNALAETGAQCDNNTSDDLEDASVNDGCPPNGAVSEGSRIPGNCSGTDEGGCIIRQNPAAGSYNFTIVLISQRDADGDGIENSLDVCALVYNPEWNPRALDLVNDPDDDGLPSVCDPAPSTKSPGSSQDCAAGLVGPDHDGDCFANRADNCPTTNQLKRPTQPPDPTDNVPDIKDSDFDGIGDACDPNINSPNGENIGYCVKFSLAVGGAPGAVAGVRDVELAPGCAAAAAITQVPVTAPPTPTPDPKKTLAPTAVGGGSGGVGGVDTGVGSLSPVSRDIPVWAAALSAAGGLGIIFGAGLLTRTVVRRREN